MSLDKSKPAQTRDGRSVVIYTWDAPGQQPIHGRVDGVVAPFAWFADGRYYGGSNVCGMDLLNAPETVERWGIINASPTLFGYNTEDEARKAAGRMGNRSVIKCTFTDGKQTAVELVQP